MAGTEFSARSRPSSAASRASRGNRRRQPQQHALVIAEHGEGNARAGHRQSAAPMSTAWSRSLRAVLRNLTPAGVATNRSRTSTLVPGGCAAGGGRALLPASTRIFPGAVGAGRAGDDVQAADRADRRQGLAAEDKSGDAEQVVVREFRGAGASTAFSTSSLTAAAGRSMTSPAAAGGFSCHGSDPEIRPAPAALVLGQLQLAPGYDPTAIRRAGRSAPLVRRTAPHGRPRQVRAFPL
jgi:hypothetical protein